MELTEADMEEIKGEILDLRERCVNRDQHPYVFDGISFSAGLTEIMGTHMLSQEQLQNIYKEVLGKNSK